MTSTASDTPKSDLLDTVITAHGDLDRWRSLDQLTAKVSAGGVLWGLKGQPGILKDYTLTLTPNLQSATMAPFAAPDLLATYTPERVAIETVDGRLVEERANPRASFSGHTLQTPWDRLHAAYFAGYAMWNYLTEAFAFSEPGFSTVELEPWQEDGETWRRLQVTFPERIATHSRAQTYYIDAQGLIRRHDYRPDVLGAAEADSAHYTWGHQIFDGFVFPTHRSVHATDENGRKVAEPVIISIDLEDIALS
jgi:hypothetical protein